MRLKLGNRIIDAVSLGPTELRRYRSRPSEFFKDVLGFELTDYQEWMINHMVSKCSKCGAGLKIEKPDIICAAGCKGDPRSTDDGGTPVSKKAPPLKSPPKNEIG